MKEQERQRDRHMYMEDGHRVLFVTVTQLRIHTPIVRDASTMCY